MGRGRLHKMFGFIKDPLVRQKVVIMAFRHNVHLKAVDAQFMNWVHVEYAKLVRAWNQISSPCWQRNMYDCDWYDKSLAGTEKCKTLLINLPSQLKIKKTVVSQNFHV